MNEPSIYGIKWEPPANKPFCMARKHSDAWPMYPMKDLPRLLQLGFDVTYLVRENY